MRTSRRVVFGALVLALAVAGPLCAATVFQFTDSGASFYATGTLTAIDNGDGTWTVIAGSGMLNEDPIFLIPGSGTSPLGAFNYNNLLYPAGNPLLDGLGLLFRNTVTAAELNIWGNGPYPPVPYSTYVGLGSGNYPLADDNSVFTLTLWVPEPATWVMLGAGLCAAWFARRLRSRWQGRPRGGSAAT